MEALARLANQDVGVLQEVENIELVLIHRVVELARGAGDLRGEDQEQHDMGDVELPSTHPQPLGGGEE